MEAVHDAKRLAELQAFPLNRKIQITQTRIIEWYQHYNGKVCVSFSGGKDSTVLLHMARKLYPDIPAVFSNTGLEYPEIQKFAKSFDNVFPVTPKMRFKDGYGTDATPLTARTPRASRCPSGRNRTCWSTSCGMTWRSPAYTVKSSR